MTGTYALPRQAFIGFDRIFDQLETIHSQAKDTYPPHNVVREGEFQYIVELAVAGFTEDDIQLEVKDHILTVKAQREQRREQNKYLDKGISARKFTKSFRLSEYTEVRGAEMKDGILAIGLEVVLPEEKRPQTITINSHKGKSNDNTSLTGLFTS